MLFLILDQCGCNSQVGGFIISISGVKQKKGLQKIVTLAVFLFKTLAVKMITFTL